MGRRGIFFVVTIHGLAAGPLAWLNREGGIRGEFLNFFLGQAIANTIGDTGKLVLFLDRFCP